MQLTVYKYPLPIADYAEVEMPANAAILTAQAQGDVPCIWALVDPSAPLAKRKFRIAGTGHQIEMEPLRLPAGLNIELARSCYIGTCQFYGGTLVLHIFEIAAATG